VIAIRVRLLLAIAVSVPPLLVDQRCTHPDDDHTKRETGVCDRQGEQSGRVPVHVLRHDGWSVGDLGAELRANWGRSARHAARKSSARAQILTLRADCTVSADDAGGPGRALCVLGT
jgi:hypothetical protein